MLWQVKVLFGIFWGLKRQENIANARDCFF